MYDPDLSREFKICFLTIYWSSIKVASMNKIKHHNGQGSSLCIDGNGCHCPGIKGLCNGKLSYQQ
jgi:hypothetical protein